MSRRVCAGNVGCLTWLDLIRGCSSSMSYIFNKSLMLAGASLKEGAGGEGYGVVWEDKKNGVWVEELRMGFQFHFKGYWNSIFSLTSLSTIFGNTTLSLR